MNRLLRILFVVLLLCPMLMVSAASTSVYQGFSGGMMLHTGYLFGQNSHAPEDTQGLCSPEGVPLGIGGALHVNLGSLFRLGCEGFVSTMHSNMSNCSKRLQDGSYIRSGWGGLNADVCWRDLPKVGRVQLWPYVGASVGGGAMRSFYLLEGSQDDWEPEQKTVFHKEPYFYVDPFVGMDICLTSKVHLTLRVDWQVALRKQEVLLPTGPRLYAGFMFCH